MPTRRRSRIASARTSGRTSGKPLKKRRYRTHRTRKATKHRKRKRRRRRSRSTKMKRSTTAKPSKPEVGAAGCVTVKGVPISNESFCSHVTKAMQHNNLADGNPAEYAQLLLRLLYCYNNLAEWNVGGVDVLEAKVGISDRIKRTFPTLNDHDDEKIINAVDAYASELQRYHDAETDLSWSCADFARPGPAGRPD